MWGPPTILESPLIPLTASLWNPATKDSPCSRGRGLNTVSFRKVCSNLYTDHLLPCSLVLWISMNPFLGIYTTRWMKTQYRIFVPLNCSLSCVPCGCDIPTSLLVRSTSLLSLQERCSRLVLSISCPSLRLSLLFSEWTDRFGPLGRKSSSLIIWY